MLGVNEGAFMLAALHHRQQMADAGKTQVRPEAVPGQSARWGWVRTVSRGLGRRGPSPVVEPVEGGEAARGALARAQPGLHR
jgi:hypothetical protein